MSIKIPHLASAMTPFPYSVNIGDLVEDAVDLMVEHRIRHIPVTDGAKVAGVVTDRDVKAAQRLLPELKSYPVETVYRADAFVVDIKTPLLFVVETMAERAIGSAIVTKDDHLAGVFTYVDACDALASVLRQAQPDDSGPDLVA